jgi:hypothetical protein
MNVFALNGSSEPASIDRRIALLTTLLQLAEQKITHIAELRQRNMNYALLLFAGLFTFTMKFPSGVYSAFVSVALLAIMAVFCKLDHRLHRFIHGWGKTKTEFAKRVNQIINEPTQGVTYLRYWADGERTAELRSLQPMVFYFLLGGGILHLSYFLVSFFRELQ